MKKIVLINIIVFLILLILLELFSVIYTASVRIYQQNNNLLLKPYESNVFKYIVKIYTNKHTFSRYDIPDELLREPIVKNTKKQPIVLFGCSVTYGYLLDSDNNFSSILSKNTNRTIYNMSYNEWSPAHMLKLLKENRNRNLFFIENPQYIIYTIIKDHKKRLFFYQGWGYDTQVYFRYQIDKNRELSPIPRKCPLYFRLFLIKNIQHSIENIKLKNEKLVDELLFKIFEESASIIKSRWPNSKLVMLVYNDDLCSYEKNKELYRTEDTLSKIEQEKFKEMGFEIYNMEELVGKSLCAEEYHARSSIYGELDRKHPSTKMWEEFVPKLVEKLGM